MEKWAGNMNRIHRKKVLKYRKMSNFTHKRNTNKNYTNTIFSDQIGKTLKI